MKNPLKKFLKPKHQESQVILVPLAMLARQAVFDTRLSDPQTLGHLLGFPPMSEDVAEMENQASIERVDAIQSLYPIISLHGDIVSEAICKYLARTGGPVDEATPDMIEEYENFLRRLCQPVMITACLSLLSVLYEYGLIHIMGSNPTLVEDNDE